MIIDAIKDFFKGKRVLRAYFIDETGRIFKKEVHYSNNIFSIKIGDDLQSYIVDHNFMVYDAKDRVGTSVYYVNNPNPVRLQHERNNQVDSISIKKILDSKAIKDLFSEENKELINWILIIVIVNIMLTLVVGAKVFNFIKWSNAG